MAWTLANAMMLGSCRNPSSWLPWGHHYQLLAKVAGRDAAEVKGAAAEVMGAAEVEGAAAEMKGVAVAVAAVAGLVEPEEEAKAKVVEFCVSCLLRRRSVS